MMVLLSSPRYVRNTAFETCTEVALSVLIPFYRDDPCAMVQRLGAAPVEGVEVILYDDGSGDARLAEDVSEAVRTASLPAMLICHARNLGRAAARNALTDAARGQWVLLLDADMMPVDKGFLRRWRDCVTQNAPAIAFGGFAVPSAADIAPEQALHRAYSQSSDCLPAAMRARHAASAVCTSNLLVRRDVLQSCPFDNGFAGWGWEDVEWAARAARDHTILHIDNPAVHLGLESADTLLRRFRDSAPNYARFVHRHPALAHTLASWKAARIIAKIPGFSCFRPLFAALARNRMGLWPLGLRILALKLWRSYWYAKALS